MQCQSIKEQINRNAFAQHCRHLQADDAERKAWNPRKADHILAMSAKCSLIEFASRPNQVKAVYGIGEDTN